MYTYQTLHDDLKKMSIDPKGTLLVHSSMKSIGPVEGGAETVLDVLCDYMKEGLLVFPTHTWSTIGAENPVYDSRSAESCVGLLTNLFLKRPGVTRSLHPTHSVAALGRDAEAYIAGEEESDSPCPKTGCWGRLYLRNATVLFIGCRLNRNTFIHSVEEWSNIPDRISDWTVPLTSIDREGGAHHTQMHRHCCSFTEDISQNYIKLEEPFAALGVLDKSKFGDAQCLVCSAKKMGDITTAFLDKDPALFADLAPVPTDWYRKE